MASTFYVGEQKVRPGAYYRYQNYGSPPTVGADDGICAAAFASEWGAINKAVLIENPDDAVKIFGSGRVGLVQEMFKGGARAVYCVRIGSDGSNGTLTLKNTSSEDAVTISTLYPSTRNFQITIRDSITDNSFKELVLAENNLTLEVLSFKKAEDETQTLVDAYNEVGSAYFSVVKIKSGELEAVNQAEVPPGTAPVIDAAAYSKGFEILEAYYWQVICVDTNNTAIHSLLQTFINRIHQQGKFPIMCVGETTTIDFDTRISHAKGFNDNRVIYVGSGFKDATDNTVDGFLAAARVAGMIAGTPSNDSIVHMPLQGAVSLTEVLTNAQHVQSIKNGMLTFSVSADKTIWIESGINTLTTLSSEQDPGWKKIKRTKVRDELIRRILNTIEPVRVNNDSDGRATIIQLASGVCQNMFAEKKLSKGARVELDSNNPPAGDSAWFAVYVDDIDTLEKTYLTFNFRFAPEE